MCPPCRSKDSITSSWISELSNIWWALRESVLCLFTAVIKEWSILCHNERTAGPKDELFQNAKAVFLFRMRLSLALIKQVVKCAMNDSVRWLKQSPVICLHAFNPSNYSFQMWLVNRSYKCIVWTDDSGTSERFFHSWLASKPAQPDN